MSDDKLQFEKSFGAFKSSPKWRGASWHVEYEEGYREYMSRSKFRWAEIVKSIPRSAGPIRILDIGTTPFTLFLKEMYPHYEVSTLDLTDIMEVQCKAYGIQLTKCNLEKGHIPFEDNSFDVVIFCEVMEHLFAPPAEILKEVRRIMRPQGKLIISVPNIAALYQRIRLLLGISPLPSADKLTAIFYRGHVHEYTMGETTALLRACNFNDVRAKYVRANSGGNTVRQLMMRGYNLLVYLVPPFRSTIHVECYK